MPRPNRIISLICLISFLALFCNTTQARLRRYATVPFASVYCFAKDAQHIYAGTDSGVFKSVDRGATWITFRNALSQLKVSVLAIRGNQIYAFTPSGLFLSTDTSLNWRPVGSALPDGAVYDLTLGADAVFAATTAGLYRSLDQGLTWQQANNGLSDLNVRHLLYFNSILVAGTPSGTYFSSDNGISWKLQIQGFKTTNIIALKAFGSILYSSTADGLYASKDTGRSWLPLAFPKTEIISLGTSQSKIFAGSLQGLYQSADSGKTWLKSDSAAKTTLYAIEAMNGTVVIAPQMGLRYSQDGGSSWQTITEGLRENTAPILEFIVYPNPSKKIFNVHFKDPGQVISYRVSDLYGKTLTVSSNFSDGELILDFGTMTRGLYFLFVQTETEIEMRRVLLY